MLKFKQLAIIAIAILLSSSLKAQTPTSDYYTDVISNTKATTVELSNNQSNSTDMTETLQNLIDEVSKYRKGNKKGGTILIKKKKKGESVYRVRNIDIKSNVRLKIDKEVIFKPYNARKSGYTIFNIGDDIKGVENVEIICSDDDEKFTIDMSETREGKKSGGFNVKAMGVLNVNNFLISDFHIIDDESKISAILFNGVFTEKNTVLHGIPQNGVLENVSAIDMHRGYSLCQVQLAKHVLFRDMHGEMTPAALNFESGAGIANVPTNKQTELGIVDDVRVENVSCTNCTRVVGFSPHGRINGSVYVDGVVANQCLTGVEVGPGFVDASVSDDTKDVNIRGGKMSKDPSGFKRGSYRNIVVRNVVFNYEKFTLYPEAVARRVLAPVSVETVKREDAHLSYDELKERIAKEGEEMYHVTYNRIKAIPEAERSIVDKNVFKHLNLDDLTNTGHYPIDVSDADVTITNIDAMRHDQGGTPTSEVRKIVYEDEPSVCVDIREGYVMQHRKGKRYQKTGATMTEGIVLPEEKDLIKRNNSKKSSKVTKESKPKKEKKNKKKNKDKKKDN